ncbi:SIR2 family protein [Leptospira yasudae]|uniref:SIR2 family protein n=1 Tax=Leptospira yasudae TaxID=2202201 RepID=UPI0010916300|nr:SIR2 family protein [Leptospira yasudae]MBW0434922.1 SIR2 family protein [Leptospira yasudae]TGM98041.1 hypothetical protein EHR10_11245 [Leptospira yasudae]
MSKFIFILGAGASAESGAPVMSNFQQQAERVHNENGLDKQWFDLVIRAQGYLQGAMAKANLDIHNIEHIFTAFEMAKIFGKLGDLSFEETQKLPNAMRRYIIDTLEHSIEFPAQQTSFTPTEPYIGFVKYLKILLDKSFIKSWSDIAIISFNYDLCTEIALDSEHIPYDYCLENEISKDSIKILKLHGSINWSVNEEGKVEFIKTRILKNSNYMPDNKPRLLLVSKHVGDAFIVPPSWNKLYHHEKLSNVWVHACKSLSNAVNIFTFGYSFPPSDLLFHYLYSIGTIGPTIIKNFFYNDNARADINQNRVRNLLGNAVSSKFQSVNTDFSVVFNTLGHKAFLDKL